MPAMCLHEVFYFAFSRRSDLRKLQLIGEYFAFPRHIDSDCNAQSHENSIIFDIQQFCTRIVMFSSAFLASPSLLAARPLFCFRFSAPSSSFSRSVLSLLPALPLLLGLLRFLALALLDCSRSAFLLSMSSCSALPVLKATKVSCFTKPRLTRLMISPVCSSRLGRVMLRGRAL